MVALDHLKPKPSTSIISKKRVVASGSKITSICYKYLVVFMILFIIN